MGWRFDGRTDRMRGHDFPGVCGHGMHQFMLDEIEFGARVTLAFNDPEQWWWEIIGNAQLDAEIAAEKAAGR
jgi:hypothetical protein